MQFKPAELAILFTLAYTDQFDFPLNEVELWQRLITLDGTNFSRPEFKKALLKLALHKQVEFVKSYLCLPGRAKVAAQRNARAVIAEKKQQEITFLQKVMAHQPGVKAVFVTGSVAMNNADEDDDLDVLIVTAPNRLWLTRLGLLFTTWILRKKKARSDEGKHGWCLNLWLDEEHLGVEEKKRDLYQAYEVLQALPVYGKADVIAKFYQANAWTNEYVPHFEKTPDQAGLEDVSLKPKKISLASTFLDWLETVAYSVQLNYMSAHRTTEKVGRGYAFFHPRPTGKLVKDGWLHSLQTLKNTDGVDTIAKKYAAKLFAKPL